MTYAYCDINS